MTISLIIPVYNESKNIPLFYAALVEVLQKLEKYNFEIIFVDDGSHDDSVSQVKKLADPRIICLEFSRNFGKEMATTAGLHHAQGEAVMMIDVDLQHPPKHIPEFIDKWESGVEVIVGVRCDNQGEGFIKKIGSILFYKIIRLISKTEIVPQATDFRLLDRCVVDEFNRFTEHSRITRGLIDWLGFRRDYVYFSAPARINGRASYSNLKLFKLAFSSFISHSLVPLRLAGYLGVIIVALSGPLGLFIFIEKYLLADPFGMNFSGPAILAVIILFLVGIILSCLGLIALYIGNIQTEVTGRPLYVLRNRKQETRNRK